MALQLDALSIAHAARQPATVAKPHAQPGIPYRRAPSQAFRTIAPSQPERHSVPSHAEPCISLRRAVESTARHSAPCGGPGIPHHRMRSQAFRTIIPWRRIQSQAFRIVAPRCRTRSPAARTVGCDAGHPHRRAAARVAMHFAPSRPEPVICTDACAARHPAPSHAEPGGPRCRSHCEAFRSAACAARHPVPGSSHSHDLVCAARQPTPSHAD